MFGCHGSGALQLYVTATMRYAVRYAHVTPTHKTVRDKLSIRRVGPTSRAGVKTLVASHTLLQEPFQYRTSRLSECHRCCKFDQRHAQDSLFCQATLACSRFGARLEKTQVKLFDTHLMFLSTSCKCCVTARSGPLRFRPSKSAGCLLKSQGMVQPDPRWPSQNALRPQRGLVSSNA